MDLAKSTHHITPEMFHKYKYEKDPVQEALFQERFSNVLNMYKSLSTMNNYRKVKKVNIIQTSVSNNSILNLLNKITEANYERIFQKIVLKITDSNIVMFIDQILCYSKSTTTNATLLWNLICMLYAEYIILYPKNKDYVKRDITNALESYMSNFFKLINVDVFLESTMKKDTLEQYDEFVERNMSNSSLFATMRMIFTILDNNFSFHLLFKLTELFDILFTELQKCINNVEHMSYIDNLTSVILECTMNFITLKSKMTREYVEKYKVYIGYFETNDYRAKMSNKNKFKLMDIIDRMRDNMPKS